MIPTRDAAAAPVIDNHASPIVEVRAWLEEPAKSARLGEITAVSLEKARPWGTVLRVETQDGTTWLKAPASGTRFEVSIYTIFKRVGTPQTLQPLAIDLERGWLLLPDGGVPLGDTLYGDSLISAMMEILPKYAELQRSLMSETTSLLSMGVPDMRPHGMCQRFEEAITFVERSMSSDAASQDDQLWTRTTQQYAAIQRWADQAALLPIGASLDHSDLHPRNILITTGSSIAS